MTIQLTFTPEHLDTIIRCTAQFRDRSGHRPTLAGLHVRIAADAPDRDRVEVTATDSYHLVRLTVPVEEVKDPQSTLIRKGGVLIDLPVGDARRALAAMRAAEKIRVRREADAEREHRFQEARAIARGDRKPRPPKKGTPVRARLVVSGKSGETTGFALDGKGSWTGGGCYLTAVGDDGRVPKIVGGTRRGEPYVNADSLLAKAAGQGDGIEPVAYRPECLGDLCDAAAAFIAGEQKGWAQLNPGQPLQPTLMHAERHDGCKFLGLIMPVRVS